MEPVTHLLTGAVLARAGFNRRAAYATVAMAVAAELPDIDMLWSAGGPVTGFEHHRGITHTFLAMPVEAAVVTAVAYGFWRLRGRPETKAVQRWGLLFGGVLLALCSHILLDWTNNYGVRPFFPFDPHWYAGSFVFIFEPVLFAILVLALVLPGLFGLINSEVGAQRRKFASSGWALGGLVLVLALYVFRFNEHAKALRLAEQDGPAEATRFFASPHPMNPYVWSTVAETPSVYQLGTVNTRSGLAEALRPADTIYKPQNSLALLAAKRSYLGRVYLDWSSWPVLAEEADSSDPNHPLTIVTFADARFLYAPVMRGGKVPLSGSVLLDMSAPEGDRVVEIRMGRVQK